MHKCTEVSSNVNTDVNTDWYVHASPTTSREKLTATVVPVGPDTSKGLLISVGAVAVLAVVTFSLIGKPSVVKQAADAASKVKDLNEF